MFFFCCEKLRKYVLVAEKIAEVAEKIFILSTSKTLAI